MPKKETNKRSVHAGHRERLKKRFLINQGADFEDHELLEMLLFYVIPRSNTNELAHELLNEFGSLKNVLNADPSIIQRVTGAGSATATFLALLFTIRKKIEMEKYTKSKFKADTLTNVGNYLVDYYQGKANEEVCAMLLDSSMRLIEFATISSGSANSAAIDIRSFVQKAVECRAYNVILAHNHPSDDLSPSAADRQLTLELDAALRTINIDLVEHIIVGSVSYAPTMYMRLTSQSKAYSNNNKYKKFYNN